MYNLSVWGLIFVCLSACFSKRKTVGGRRNVLGIGSAFHEKKLEWLVHIINAISLTLPSLTTNDECFYLLEEITTGHNLMVKNNILCWSGATIRHCFEIRVHVIRNQDLLLLQWLKISEFACIVFGSVHMNCAAVHVLASVTLARQKHETGQDLIYTRVKSTTTPLSSFIYPLSKARFSKILLLLIQWRNAKFRCRYNRQVSILHLIAVLKMSSSPFLLQQATWRSVNAAIFKVPCRKPEVFVLMRSCQVILNLIVIHLSYNLCWPTALVIVWHVCGARWVQGIHIR